MRPDLQKNLTIYKALLIKWSKAINLVSPSTLKEVERRHFKDSLQLVRMLPDETKTLFDFGSGAGFPALVIALARPDIQVHLFESDQKKCSFLATVSRETFIPVVIHNDRVENVDKTAIPTPDVITARALASLEELLELSSPWWNGRSKQPALIFPKGAKAEEEIRTAQEKFTFSITRHASETDPDARILVITDIARIKPSSTHSS